MNHNNKSVVTVLRWVARIASLASLGFVLFFLIGERFNPADVRLREWPLFACFPLGVCAGIAVGWRKEKLGGLVTLASLLGFYAVEFLLSGRLAGGPWPALVAAPGALFLLCGLWSAKGGRHEPVSH